MEPDPGSAGVGKASRQRAITAQAVSYPDTAFFVPMHIRLNGEDRHIPDGLTVRALLEHLGIKPERVAVEINEEIVRKPVYAEVPVREGDRVEVVQFMGGG